MQFVSYYNLFTCLIQYAKPIRAYHYTIYGILCHVHYLQRASNRYLKASKCHAPLIAKMIPFVNISNFFQVKKIIFIMTLHVAHWDTLDGNFVF